MVFSSLEKNDDRQKTFIDRKHNIQMSNETEKIAVKLPLLCILYQQILCLHI